MINSIFKLFDRAMKWNAFEGIIYQSILTLHQIILFSLTDRFNYGLMGVLFSILYFAVLFFNFGFDKSLAPFFSLITSNKKNFKKIFVLQITIQLLILICIFLFITVFNNKIANLFSREFKCFNIEFDIWATLGLLLVCESLKKSLRAICELAFLNKYTAIIEIVLIIFYTTIFWLYYFQGHSIDLHLVFSPLLMQSFIGIIALTVLVKSKIYDHLSNNNLKLIHDINYKIAINRLSNYINQLSHIPFSANFFIPFVSSIYGLEKISIFKLINVIVVYFSVVLERTFGLTSAALLSHLKNASYNIKQKALNLATQKLVFILYAIIIFFVINSRYALQAYLNVSENWPAIYFFLILLIFDNFFITLEQFYIVEEKIYYYAILNLSLGTLFYSITNFVNLPLNFLLFLFLIIRIILFFCLKQILKVKLKITLKYKIDFRYIVIFFLFSTLFLIILRVIN